MRPHRSRSLVASLSLFALALAGCAGGSSAAVSPRTPAKQGQTGPTVEVPPTVVSPYDNAELAREFEKARALLLDGKYGEAAPAFDRLTRLAPDGPTAAPSFFNAGLAHEALGERSVAIERYRVVVQRFADSELAREAATRLVNDDAYVEKWDDLRKDADELLARKDLTILESIAGHGAKALALIEQEQLDEAAREVATARDIIEQNRLGEAGRPPLELAEVSFALGEVRRHKSEKILFVPVPPNFADVLEARCTGLLDAQNAYTEAMKSLDAHWSAMAGYRIGQLYQTLHHDVMQIPPPDKAKTLKQKQLFEGAMRLRYRVLLEKGLKMMDGTVRLGERTGEDSTWVHRAADAKRDLERAFEDEKNALAKLPFTEQELQDALDRLKSKP